MSWSAGMPPWRRLVARALVALAIATLAGSGLSLAAARGWWEAPFLVFLAAPPVFVLGAGVAFAVLLAEKRRAARRVFRATLAATLLLGLSFIAGRAVYDARMGHLKAECGVMIAQIEAFLEAHGHPPEELDAASGRFCVREGVSYEPGRWAYSVSIPYRYGTHGSHPRWSWRYESDSQRWELVCVS